MNSLVDVVGAEHSFGPWFDTPLPRRGNEFSDSLERTGIHVKSIRLLRNSFFS